jgi:hypothetical protein
MTSSERDQLGDSPSLTRTTAPANASPAAGDRALIGTIDRLSKKLRERIGEALKDHPRHGAT